MAPADGSAPVFQRSAILALIGSAKPHRLVIVLGSPVPEVGRDHDDWARFGRRMASQRVG
ncbi:hypothetical protein CCO03_14510 [Comamonas serinivorans]|uniref:Uncharacterized protein n=1 Tax=Comamonas serinivorans TaxID=1082851 RepID=A0A1Y0EQ07_9BURK|nr:hypothetical protein CCO03_14510 [Comamonas serinivorans]